jgi:hypothetical protein
MSMNSPETPSSVPSTLSPGTQFGSYEILQQLGAGGMGEVYRARDTRLERQVAIKTLSLEWCCQPDALARFEQEARSACALNHPNIVTIYEFGHVNGTRYISMELVIGETVRELLAAGPIPFRKAIAIAAQSARDRTRSSRSKAGEPDGFWRCYRQDSGFRSGETEGASLSLGFRCFDHADGAGNNNGHRWLYVTGASHGRHG